jgi:hypothetical protein
LNKQKDFKAFGSNALDLYYGGEDGHAVGNYGENGDLLFEKFKMALNSSDIRSYTAPALSGETGCIGPSHSNTNLSDVQVKQYR